MPTSPPHLCPTPGCPTLVPAGHRRCPAHTTEQRRQHHDTNRAKVYASKRWKATRRTVLERQPYCPGWPDGTACHALATDVDHIEPLRDVDDPYDLDNLQALCRPCHSRKTAREVGWTKTKHS